MFNFSNHIEGVYMDFMSEPAKSLDAILESFEADVFQPDPSARKALTIWLTPADKERYDRIQKRSGRRFCDKLRELVVAAIQRCDQEPDAAA